MADKIKPIVAIVDTREKNPLDLTKHGIEVVHESLPYGDYSIKYPNLVNHVAVERKSLQDFLMCCGRERKRFDKELQGLRGYKYSFVICEFNYPEIFSHLGRSRINRHAVSRSIARWQVMGVDIRFCGNRESSERYLCDYFSIISKDVFSFAKQCVEV